MLSSCEWMDVYNNCAVDDPCLAHLNFICQYLSFHNECFPLISTVSSPGCKQPWMTSALLKSCRAKNKLYKSFIKHPTSQNKSAFITYGNVFSKLRMAAKKSYYNNLFSEYKCSLHKTLINLFHILIIMINYLYKTNSPNLSFLTQPSIALTA